MKRINDRFRRASEPSRSAYESDEARFRMLIEAGADGVLVIGLDGIIAFANPAACTLMGRSSDQLVGHPFGIPVVPGETTEVDIHRGNGMVRVAEMRTAAAAWRGAPAHLATLRDVTERKRAEDAVRNQNGRLRLLNEAAGHLLTAEDPDAMVRGLFERVRDHLGIDGYFNYLVSETDDSLTLGSCAGIPDEAARAIARLEFGQTVCGTSALLKRPITVACIQESDDPMMRLVRSLGIRAYACNPLMAGDRVLGTLSFVSRTRDRFGDDDLEFLRTLCYYAAVAYERGRLIHRLREDDRRKNEFLAMLAHELRNPLAAITNAAQLAARSNTDEPRAQGHEVIARQCGHLARLIDDLLDVSRITRGKIGLRPERLDVAAVLHGAVEAVRPLIEQRGHTLDLSVPVGTLWVEGDPTRLEQIAMNLLANAAKYTEPGGRIALTAQRVEADVVIKVRDNGMGLAPEMLAKVFEPFAQVERSIDRAQGGLGIGLTLVRALAELHNGSVSVTSDGQGKGCEFVVRIPAGEMTPEAAAGDLLAAATPASSSPRALRILVVDDNRDLARLTAALLETSGHTAQAVHDGPSALESVRAYRPDVVLLDIGLPGMDGYQVATALRQEADSHGMRIIAVTGYGEEQAVIRSRESGIDDHLTKPVDIDALLSLIIWADDHPQGETES